MDLIVLVLVIAVIGAVVWAVTTYVPMPPVFVTIIYIVCAIVLILFVVNQFAGRVPNVIK